VPGEGFLDISIIAPRIQGPRGADRGFIAGRSGAGKSFLAKRLLASYGISESVPKEFRGNLVILDANDTFNYPAEERYETVDEFRLNKKIRAVSYVPKPDQYAAEKWNELWRKLFYFNGPLMVYADETRAMEGVFGNRSFDDGNFFIAYLTRGRAKGKAAILGAQRPVRIPRDIIGQAEWYYVFDLPLKDDRQTMAGTIGELGIANEQNGQPIYRRIDDMNALGRFEFWFKGPDTPIPIKMMVVK